VTTIARIAAHLATVLDATACELADALDVPAPSVRRLIQEHRAGGSGRFTLVLRPMRICTVSGRLCWTWQVVGADVMWEAGLLRLRKATERARAHRLNRVARLRAIGVRMPAA